MTSVCPDCGSQRDPAWRFCRSCGSARPVESPAEVFCVDCGAIVEPAWRFCRSCGAPSPASTTEPPAPPSLDPEQLERIRESLRGPRPAADGPEPPSIELISRRDEVIDIEPTPALIRQPAAPRLPANRIDDRLHAGESESLRRRLLPEPTPVRSAESLARYRSPTALGQVTAFAFLVLAVLAVATVLGLLRLNLRLEEVGGQGEAVAAARSLVDTWLRPLTIAAGIVAFGLLVAWSHRVYANIAAFGLEDLRAPTSWIVPSWFVPLANLVLPQQLVGDAWRGAAPGAENDPDWRARATNPWVVAWWGLLVACVVALIAVAFLATDSLEAALDANAWNVVGYGLLAFASVAAIRAILAIDNRQEAHYRGVSAVAR